MARRILAFSFLALLAVVLVWRLSDHEKTPLRVTPEVREQDRQVATKEAPASESARVPQVTESASSEIYKEARGRDPIPVESLPKPKRVNTTQAQLERDPLFGETDWKIWTGVRAIAKNHGSVPKALGEVNGFYLVEDGEFSDVGSFSSERPLVVVDTRLNLAGVVTGVFIVKLKEGVSPDVITSAENLKVVSAFPHIRTYMVTSNHEPFDLRSFKEFLSTESSFEDVQMEILSRQYGKN